MVHDCEKKIQDTVHFQSRIRSMFLAKFVAHYQNYFDCDLGFKSQRNLMNQISHQLNSNQLSEPDRRGLTFDPVKNMEGVVT